MAEAKKKKASKARWAITYRAQRRNVMRAEGALGRTFKPNATARSGYKARSEKAVWDSNRTPRP